VHWPFIKGEPSENLEITFQSAVESTLKEAVL
jgi:hypothetical protein